ncbi:MAG: DUF4126 family protein [Gemmatimonadaceae bacterium]
MPVHSDPFFYISALILGFVAGMRTMMPVAILAITLCRRPELAPASNPVHWLTLRPVAILISLAALGELVVDKLPRTPNRIALGPFLGRLILGGFAGAALMQLGGISAWIGAACGTVGAIVGSLVMFYLRRVAGRTTGIRDPYIGAVEDVLAIAIASTVVAMLVS